VISPGLSPLAYGSLCLGWPAESSLWPSSSFVVAPFKIIRELGVPLAAQLHITFLFLYLTLPPLYERSFIHFRIVLQRLQSSIGKLDHHIEGILLVFVFIAGH
jgi:hypothetical protein